MLRCAFSPDIRNVGGRHLIVDGLVAHKLTLGQISSRNPQSRQNRLRSRVKSSKKSLSRNSETKNTVRGSKQQLPIRQPKRPRNNRPLWRQTNTAHQIKQSYNELDLRGVQKENSNRELIDSLKPSDFVELSKAKRRVFKKILTHIVKRRIIRDEQFDQLYIDIVDTYPEFEKEIRDILVEVVASLDI